MSAPHLYALSGIALAAVGLLGALGHRDLVRRTIGVNVCGSGVFLVLVALARRGEAADPVPHALVLTGIVVSISATAVALALAVRLQRDALEVGRRAGDSPGRADLGDVP
jgi:multicomponent Na+:H+ antiporter subunit C